jgi:hypothetical protein
MEDKNSIDFDMLASISQRLEIMMLKSLTFLFFTAILGVWFFRDNSNLRHFDPQKIAAYETQSWKAYYEHRWLKLGLDLYLTCRNEYGFSPWNSLRLCFHATQAARVFRLQGNSEKTEILKHLTDYYSIISSHSTTPLNPHKCAALEYDWWQMRREKRPPVEISNTIANLLSEIYQTPSQSLLPSASLRVEMMQYRDERRNQKIEPTDWTFIQTGLNRSYHLLKEEIVQ